MLQGCVQSANSGSQMYQDQYSQDFKRLAISSPDQLVTCKIGSCWCMVCQNGTNIFGPMRSLIGGYCYMETNCSQTKTANLTNITTSPSTKIRMFMMGQGLSFSDFANAQPYCNNRMTMAVQWLIGGNNTPYTLPSAQRSMCLLSKDVMPVYVLYSGGQNINATQAAQIGTILGNDGKNYFQGRLTSGPVGPVVVVTEIDFNISQAPQVAAEVQAINSNCGNDRANHKIYCWVAVAPKINDIAALDAVMQLAGPDNVDLVAYGINGHYVHTCDGPTIRLQALNFSSYALYHWGKPSIIPYIMFEPHGNDTDNSCTWTESSVVSAYGSFYPFAIDSLEKRGVIGMAPYSFNATTYNISNPLNCQDCAVGSTPQRLQAWYGGCQAYTNVSSSATTSRPSAGTMIIFPNESGGYCPQNEQLDFLKGITFADAVGNPDIMNPVAPPCIRLRRSCTPAMSASTTTPPVSRRSTSGPREARLP